VIVAFILEGGPAAQAGMQPGAVISEFKGKPINEAIQEVQPPSAPHSTESNLRLEQIRYLVRAPIGSKASVTFTNPKAAAAKTSELEAVQEQESLSATSPYRNVDPNGLPVEYVVANERVGYIRISSNYDDLNLIIRLFQRALTKFTENDLKTVIIDMRANPGGAPLGLAGYLTDQPIQLGQLEYYSSKTGKFEPEGTPEEFMPNEEQFRFDHLFLLVDSACASACELESYGFSQVPGMQVIGETPTSGTEAEVSRGQFELPEGFSLRIPTGRFVLADGSIFLEGKGVQPDVLVPVTEESVLSSNDPLIIRALELANQ
jgi:C-terminal processing protease CtpA/Prc